ncbi:MAG: Hsp20/alpha crystallin family protein [Eubacteriales bacterium]|nr:Hsp20/alpha crystallin family protein [Eubacteriales bacterium]
MLLPRIWDEDLFEDMDNLMSWPDERSFFGGKNNPLYGKHAKNLMKTDVKENDDSYEVDIDLPGFKKDEVTVSLENGYLNISAAKGLDKDETDKKTGKYIRRERYAGSCSRSFYVGEAAEPEDVSAKFEDGILHLTIQKKEAKKVEKKDNRIAIEG